MHNIILSQLDQDVIIIHGLCHGGVREIRLTREQALKVLEGGELVVQDGKVLVR